MRIFKKIFFFPQSIKRCICLRADLTDVHVFSQPLVMILSGVLTYTLWLVLHSHLLSSERERWSQEQCKLGKMFRKVAFPTGTSQLQFWVSTLCLCVFVWVWEHKLFFMCLVHESECMPECVFLPISLRLSWAVILGLVESERERVCVSKARRW